MLQQQPTHHRNNPLNYLANNLALFSHQSNADNSTCSIQNYLEGPVNPYNLQDHLDRIANTVSLSNQFAFGVSRAISNGIEDSSWRQNHPNTELSSRFTESQYSQTACQTDKNHCSQMPFPQDDSSHFMKTLKSWYNSCGVLWDISVDMNTDIHRAICRQNHDQLLLAISKNPELINSKNIWDLTPLHIAIQKRDLKCVQILVQNGASLNIPGGWPNKYPGEMALEKGHLGIVHYIDSLNGWFDRNGSNLIHIYAMMGDLKNIKKLLTGKNSDIKCPSACGITPLVMALDSIRKPLKPKEYTCLSETIMYLIHNDPDLFNTQRKYSLIDSTLNLFRYLSFYQHLEHYRHKLDFEEQERVLLEIEKVLSLKFSEQFGIRHISEFQSLGKIQLDNTEGSIYIDTQDNPKRYFIEDSISQEVFLQKYLVSSVYQKVSGHSNPTNQILINNIGKIFFCTPIIQEKNSILKVPGHSLSIKLLIKDLLFELIMNEFYPSPKIVELNTTNNNKKETLLSSNQYFLGQYPELKTKIKSIFKQPEKFIHQLLQLVITIQKDKAIPFNSKSHLAYMNSIKTAIKEVSSITINKLYSELQPRFKRLEIIIDGRRGYMFDRKSWNTMVKQLLAQLDPLLGSLKSINHYLLTQSHSIHPSKHQEWKQNDKIANLLHQYVRFGNLNKTRGLIENNSNINIKSTNSYGKTPLSVALKRLRTPLHPEEYTSLARTIMYLIKNDSDLFNRNNQFSLFDSGRNYFRTSPFYNFSDYIQFGFECLDPKEKLIQNIELHLSLRFSKEFKIRHIKDFEWLSKPENTMRTGSIYKDRKGNMTFIQEPLKRKEFLMGCILPIIYQSIMGYPNATNEVIISASGKLLLGSPITPLDENFNLRLSPKMLIKSLLFEWMLGSYFPSMEAVNLLRFNHDTLQTLVTCQHIYPAQSPDKRSLRHALPMLRQPELFTTQFLTIVGNIQDTLNMKSNFSLNKSHFKMALKEMSKDIDTLLPKIKQQFTKIEKILIGRSRHEFFHQDFWYLFDNLNEKVDSSVKYFKKISHCLENDFSHPIVHPRQKLKTN